MPIETIVDAMNAPLPKTPSRLWEIFEKLSVDTAWVQNHIPDPLPPDRYYREVIHSSHDYEIVLAVWPPYSRTPIHNHGEPSSSGMIKVLAGKIFNHIYKLEEKSEDEEVALVDRQSFQTGDLIKVPRGLIHSMGSAEPSQLAMSLHLYVPVICHVTNWDPETLQKVSN